MIHLYLGGSFDPVHDGHLDIVRHVFHRLSLNPLTPACFSISFLPTAGNPLKDKPTDPAHRLAMLSLACQILHSQNIHATICSLEIHQPPPVYTIDTVRTLADKYPNDEQIFIMGGDSLANLSAWKSHQEILRLIKIWSFARAGITDVIKDGSLANTTTDFDEFLKNKPPLIFCDNMPVPAISSSQIRAMIYHDKNPSHVPKLILDYIKQHQLYKDMV